MIDRGETAIIAGVWWWVSRTSAVPRSQEICEGSLTFMHTSPRTAHFNILVGRDATFWWYRGFWLPRRCIRSGREMKRCRIFILPILVSMWTCLRHQHPVSAFVSSGLFPFSHVHSRPITHWPVAVARIARVESLDDLDGTVTEERITNAAGGEAGQALTKKELIKMIKAAGRIPLERDTLYNVINENF